MASNPHLRQVPERLRVKASALARGPVRLSLLAVLVTGLPAASQLARLSRGKAALLQAFIHLDPHVRVA
jgi:hypothetical protein